MCKHLSGGYLDFEVLEFRSFSRILASIFIIPLPVGLFGLKWYTTDENGELLSLDFKGLRVRWNLET